LKDLVKARLSIDTTMFLIEKLESYLDEAETTQFKQMVSSLQFTFLRESNLD
jgi:hypothetical protein